MKLLKLIFLIILLYFLALIESSFLIHFQILSILPNLILILVVTWNVLEDEKKYLGIFIALIGGFFLDIFSSRLIGFNILILVILSFLIKLFLKRYVRIPFFEKI